MTVTGIITSMIIGFILGVLGRALAPGKQNIPLWLTIIVGIIAALAGTAIVGNIRNTDGIDAVEIITQVVLAVIGVLIVARLYPNNSRH